MNAELLERVGRLTLLQDSQLLHQLVGWFGHSEEFEKAVERLIDGFEIVKEAVK